MPITMNKILPAKKWDAPMTIWVGTGSSAPRLPNMSSKTGTTFHRITAVSPRAMINTAMG